jgi:hypothetical protein
LDREVGSADANRSTLFAVPKHLAPNVILHGLTFERLEIKVGLTQLAIFSDVILVKDLHADNLVQVVDEDHVGLIPNRVLTIVIESIIQAIVSKEFVFLVRTDRFVV